MDYVDYDVSCDQIMSWDEDLRALAERVAAPLFTRPEPRATFVDLVRGLLGDVTGEELLAAGRSRGAPVSTSAGVAAQWRQVGRRHAAGCGP